MTYDTFSTYPVVGDTDAAIEKLQAGDTVRAYTGLLDTDTIVSVQADYSQLGKRYTVTLEQLGPLRGLRAGETMRLATAGPRKPLTPEYYAALLA